MKLKNVAHVISVELLIFVIFFDVVELSYNPSNFARAILLSAEGQRVKHSPYQNITVEEYVRR